MKKKNLLLILLPFFLAGCSLLRNAPRNDSYTPVIPEETSSSKAAADHTNVRFVTASDATQYEMQVLQPGEKPTDPGEPERYGYVFEGWYADQNYKKGFDFNKTYDEEDIYVYAKWAKIDYYLYGYVDNTEISEKETRESSVYHFVKPEGQYKEAGATGVLYNIHLLPYDDLKVLVVREDGTPYNGAYSSGSFRTPGYYNVIFLAETNSLQFDLLEADEWVVEFRTPHTEGELVTTFEKDHDEGNKSIFIAHDLHVTVGLKVVIIFAYSGNYEKSKFSSNFEMVGFGDRESDYVTWYQIQDPLVDYAHQVGIEFHVDRYYDVSLAITADLTQFNELILTFTPSRF